jgi:hypothetical protein
VTASEPVDHVLRPVPPWRDAAALTECGRPTNDIGRVLTRDEFTAKVTAQGKTRSAMTSCITCWQTASRHPAWEQDPVAAMRREVGYGAPGSPQLLEELRAIALLIETHSDEFRELLIGLGETTSLDEVRERRRSRVRYGGAA